MTSEPPGYAEIPVVYDETFHGRWDMSPSVDSMGNATTFMGRLEHHSPTTDGTFSICYAGGSGVFVQKALYEAIPEAHRPPLRADAATEVPTLMGGNLETIGTTIMPVVLTNRTTGKPFIIKLHAHVCKSLLPGMFISSRSAAPFFDSQQWGGGKVITAFKFGDRTEEVEYALRY